MCYFILCVILHYYPNTSIRRGTFFLASNGIHTRVAPPYLMLLSSLVTDSTDIVDSKLKLILGLIWTLILHYSISMPMWEGEEDMHQGDAKEGPTPKQRLLIWVQNKLPEVPVRNFTTDWNDGKAIGALVDAVGPGNIPSL